MVQQAIERAAPSRLALEMWGAERLQVLKEQIAPGASDAELDLFATVAKRTGLDPFARQIWSIQRRQQVEGQWVTRQVIQIGVHGLRLIASRTREFQGELGPEWCGPDERWTSLWLSAEHPSAARVGVRRKGFPEPIWSVAVWDRAVQTDRTGNPMALWKTRGPEQLALAAERDALRRAFPIETADIEAVFDDQEVQANAARYVEIFGTEEDRDRDGVPHKQAVHAGRVVDTHSGEVLAETLEADANFRCTSCGSLVKDQSGQTINDNQRELLLQRFGAVICRDCRNL